MTLRITVKTLQEVTKDLNKTLTELFSLPNQVSGHYQVSAERTNQPHTDALQFFPNWRFQLLIGPAYFTWCCHLLTLQG